MPTITNQGSVEGGAVLAQRIAERRREIEQGRITPGLHNNSPNMLTEEFARYEAERAKQGAL